MSSVPPDIGDNLRFLIAESRTQLDDLKQFMLSREPAGGRRVLDRRGYSENLMRRIQNGCIQHIAAATDRDTPRLRSILAIAADLERLIELARDAIHYASAIRTDRMVAAGDHASMLEGVIEALALIEPALTQNDARVALKIGAIERRIHLDYEKRLKQYTRAIKQKKQIEDLISALLLAHTLQRMGDLLMNFSETLLSAVVGQPMDIDRYHTLMDALQRLSNEDKVGRLALETIAETRSGSGVAGIADTKAKKKCSSEYLAVYKDGLPRKLKLERKGVENWHEIQPGLAPKILAYNRRGNSASLLIEHLAGMTFQQILLKESEVLLSEALQQLGETLNRVWNETVCKKRAAAGFMKQLNRRIADVYAVHPRFERASSDVCGYRVASFGQLVKKAEKREQALAAPFSVYIHGDFNVDNIIYDPATQKLNYIDLHRSCHMDYVQDVSVFMVSNYRLQIMDAPIRRRIVRVVGALYSMASRFARSQGDAQFDLRLALGLARSFATSTRFVLDETLATAMYLRARYLLEQFLTLKKRDYSDYRVPLRALFDG